MHTLNCTHIKFHLILPKKKKKMQIPLADDDMMTMHKNVYKIQNLHDGTDRAEKWSQTKKEKKMH